MAKSKKSSSVKNIIIAICAAVLGILLFATLFMPCYKTKEKNNEDPSRISSKDVIKIMSVDKITLIDVAQGKYSMEEFYAAALLSDEDVAPAFKAAAVLNLIASIFGGLLAILAVLSLFFKHDIIKMLVVTAAVMALLVAIGCLISAIVFLQTKVVDTKISENVCIHVAPILALIYGAGASVCAFIKK